jgi:acyl carrier protein
MENVQQKIYAQIAEKLGVEEWQVKDEASFTDDLGADSLDVYELFAAIEKDLEITIPEEAAEKLTTVGALKNYVLKITETAAVH